MAVLTFVTAECKDLLPESMVGFLWRLAEQNGAEHQQFILSRKYTENGEAQDILHRAGKMSSWRRVFGGEAVEAAVEVRTTDYGVIMSLAQAPAAVPAQAAGKGAGTCLA